jgi:uncharacterized membrane protein
VVKLLTPQKKLFLLVLAYFIFFSTLDLLRHYSFTQNANDVAVFDQSLWWFLYGKGFYNSLEGISHFAVHNSPILFLLLPIYAVFPSPVTLILCQTLACAIAIVPVFLIASRVFNEKTGLWYALLFAMYHPLHGVAWDLLNELCYCVAPLLFAFYAFLTRRWGWMWICLLLALACKEELGFVVGFFGLYLFFLGLKQSQKSLFIQGLLLFFLGTSWSFFSVDWLIPHIRHAPYQYFSIENRYAFLGNSMGGIFVGMIQHPWLVLKIAFTRPKIFYLLELLAPLAFLSLRAPATLFIPIPTIAANLLSSASMMSMVGGRYPAPIIPFVFTSAILGAKKIVQKSSSPQKTLLKILRIQLLFTLLCTLLLSSNPLRLRIVHVGGIPILGFKIPWITQHDCLVEKVIKKIPPGSIVATQPNFTGHVPHGCLVSPFFRKDAKYVLLDPSFSQWYRDSGMTPSEIKKSGYKLLFFQDGIFLFQR